MSTSNPLMLAFAERFPDYVKRRALKDSTVKSINRYADLMGISFEEACRRNAEAFLVLPKHYAHAAVEDATVIVKKADR